MVRPFVSAAWLDIRYHPSRLDGKAKASCARASPAPRARSALRASVWPPERESLSDRVAAARLTRTDRVAVRSTTLPEPGRAVRRRPPGRAVLGLAMSVLRRRRWRIR